MTDKIILTDNLGIAVEVINEPKELSLKDQLIRKHLHEALWWAEQHTDTAVMRRIRDYKETVSCVRKAMNLIDG